MSESRLILTPLRKAWESLSRVLSIEKTDIVRDATIQRFEYTYEIAWKMMKRHLEWSGVADVDSLSRRDLFREAARAGLIDDAERWFEFLKARNVTSHTYNESIAEEVYLAARAFRDQCSELLRALEAAHG